MDDAIDAYFSTLYSEEHPEPDAFAAELVRGAVRNAAAIDRASPSMPNIGAWNECRRSTVIFCAWPSSK